MKPTNATSATIIQIYLTKTTGKHKLPPYDTTSAALAIYAAFITVTWFLLNGMPKGPKSIALHYIFKHLPSSIGVTLPLLSGSSILYSAYFSKDEQITSQQAILFTIRGTLLTIVTQIAYQFLLNHLHTPYCRLYHRTFSRVKTGWRQGILQNERKEKSTRRFIVNQQFSVARQLTSRFAGLVTLNTLFFTLLYVRCIILSPLRFLKLFSFFLCRTNVSFSTSVQNCLNTYTTHIDTLYLNQGLILYETMSYCQNEETFRDIYLYETHFPFEKHSKNNPEKDENPKPTHHKNNTNTNKKQETWGIEQIDEFIRHKTQTPTAQFSLSNSMLISFEQNQISCTISAFHNLAQAIVFDVNRCFYDQSCLSHLPDCFNASPIFETQDEKYPEARCFLRNSMDVEWIEAGQLALEIRGSSHPRVQPIFSQKKRKSSANYVHLFPGYPFIPQHISPRALIDTGIRHGITSFIINSPLSTQVGHVSIATWDEALGT